jgi:quaternary ammonium compound-resistance protein SugE
MNWILLIIAGLFEVGLPAVWARPKKRRDRFRLLDGGFFVCLSISMFLLYKVTQTLPIGTAYAVWTGIGAVGTVLVGILFLRNRQLFGGFFSFRRSLALS